MVCNPFCCFIFTFHVIRRGFDTLFPLHSISFSFFILLFDAMQLWLIAPPNDFVVKCWCKVDMQMKVKFQQEIKKADSKIWIVTAQLLEMRVWLSQRSESMLKFQVGSRLSRANARPSSFHDGCFEKRNGARCQTINIILVNILVLCCMPTAKPLVIPKQQKNS